MALIALTRHHFGVYIADLPGQCGQATSRIKRVITGATEIETYLTIFQTFNCSLPHLEALRSDFIATSTRKQGPLETLLAVQNHASRREKERRATVR
jgi:hypothetical protein